MNIPSRYHIYSAFPNTAAILVLDWSIGTVKSTEKAVLTWIRLITHMCMHWFWMLYLSLYLSFVHIYVWFSI